MVIEKQIDYFQARRPDVVELSDAVLLTTVSN